MAKRPTANAAATSVDHLGDAGRTLRDSIMQAYQIDDPASAALLSVACKEADRAAQADALVQEHGMSYFDKGGVLRPNVFLRIGRESRLAMTRALHAMGLDLEPLRDGPGRPRGS